MREVLQGRLMAWLKLGVAGPPEVVLLGADDLDGMSNSDDL